MFFVRIWNVRGVIFRFVVCYVILRWSGLLVCFSRILVEGWVELVCKVGRVLGCFVWRFDSVFGCKGRRCGF